MTILHVTDFHFNQRWFDWLLNHAPAHDLVVMSGDMLDHATVTPQRRQIDWVTGWLNEFPRPLSVCSGNHDLEWDSATDRWNPAYWLRSLTNPGVWTDGQRIERDGLSFLNIGATTRPKGGEADAWIVHAAPSGTRVATRPNGADWGDPDLGPAVRRYAPRLVFTGHVHQPRHWRELRDGTLFLNPGRSEEGSFPNHILVETQGMGCRFISATREETFAARLPAPRNLVAEDATVAVA
jgi:predicted phosphodiesterase